LTNKPQNWAKCEIQIYKYSVHPNPIGNPLLHLLVCGCNWSEDTIDWRYNDLYLYCNWKIDNIDDRISHNEGFQRFDITDYIKDNTSITLGSYSILINWESWVYLYSTEANISIEYKPQLIWS